MTVPPVVALLTEVLKQTINTTNVTPGLFSDTSWAIRILNILVCIIVLVLGLFGNILVIAIFGSKWSTLKSFEIYIVSLAIADLLGTVVLPTRELNKHLGGSEHHIGVAGCKLMNFLSSTSITVSALTLVAISIDRYIIIKWPFREHSRKLSLGCVVAGTWIVGMCITTIYLVDDRLILAPYGEVHMCLLNYTHSETQVLISAIFTVQSGIPLILMIIIYSLIIYQLNQSTNPQIFQNRDKEMQVRVKRNRKISNLLVVIVVVFFVTIIPQRAFYLAYTFSTELKSEVALFTHVNSFLVMLLMANSCVNPIIYSKFHISFRRVLLRVFCCCIDRYRSLEWRKIPEEFYSTVRKVSGVLSRKFSDQYSFQSSFMSQTSSLYSRSNGPDEMEHRRRASSSGLKDDHPEINKRKMSAPSIMAPNTFGLRKSSEYTIRSSISSRNSDHSMTRQNSARSKNSESSFTRENSTRRKTTSESSFTGENSSRRKTSEYSFTRDNSTRRKDSENCENTSRRGNSVKNNSEQCLVGDSNYSPRSTNSIRRNNSETSFTREKSINRKTSENSIRSAGSIRQNGISDKKVKQNGGTGLSLNSNTNINTNPPMTSFCSALTAMNQSINSEETCQQELGRKGSLRPLSVLEENKMLHPKAQYYSKREELDLTVVTRLDAKYSDDAYASLLTKVNRKSLRYCDIIVTH